MTGETDLTIDDRAGDARAIVTVTSLGDDTELSDRAVDAIEREFEDDPDIEVFDVDRV